MTSPVLPGDFCCKSIDGAVGKLISIGEWLNGDGFSVYDHAEIFVGDYDQNAPYGYTIGAYPGGAAKVPLPCKPLAMPNTIWSSQANFGLTLEIRTKIVANATRMLGTPYSALDYFAIAAHRFDLPIPWLKNFIASTKHMICSQLVDYVYLESGIHLFSDGRWPGYVTPADLANLIKEKS